MDFRPALTHAACGHPEHSTGQNWNEPALVAARFRVIDRVFGRLALPVRLAFAWRHRRRLGRRMALVFRR